jgi:hypothetical protein
MRGANMRRRCWSWRGRATGIVLAWALAGMPAIAADSLAENPSNISVTVYRAPYRGSGSIGLDELGGFALVSETRTVHLSAGVSRLRFEGVADGIEPASAIITGLPDGIIEKNREGKLLSPSALMAAAVGKSVTLLRTDRITGKQWRAAGTVRSDAAGGVVFETSEGIEALRCSGLAESFSFTGVADLAATPTLSVQVQSPGPVTRTVTLSYLARGFDWAADYIATVSADGKSMDVGAWVTLANGNGVGFPAAQTQVVAGRVNRESGEVEPLDVGGPILAQCWPRGSTSDPPETMQIELASPLGAARDGILTAITQTSRLAAPAAMQDIMRSAPIKVEQEQLGDLKLYRVPDRTTIASRQSKQVRLMDRLAVPVSFVYSADLAAGEAETAAPAHLLLRTVNNTANHLGLPLPSGRIAVFARHGAENLLQHESGMRDLAVDEEVEIDMGDTPDVRVTRVKEQAGFLVGISNARATEIQFELRLRLPEGGRVVGADHPLGSKNGRPILRLTIPANQTATLRYQTQGPDRPIAH